WLIWSNGIALALWTRASEILSANGNANWVAENYFLPRCGNLINNQSGLKGRIVTCRQQTNLQGGGMKLPLGVFIAQSFDYWHLGLSWSRPALTLDVKTQPQKRNCRHNDVHDHRQRHKKSDKQLLFAS